MTVGSYIRSVAEALGLISCDAIKRMAQHILKARNIYIAGNGGSASTASHFTCDLIYVLERDHGLNLNVRCLTDSPATLTAVANDEDYDEVFLRGLGRVEPDSLFIAITSSGNSVNLIQMAHFVSRKFGAKVIALIGGAGGALLGEVDDCVLVKASNQGAIEDVQLVICHAICRALTEVEA